MRAGPPPAWAATNAYPFVYIGAGTTCVTLGRIVAGQVRRWRDGRLRSPADTANELGVSDRLAVGVAIACGFVLAAQTNLDLIGNNDFLLTWWGYFAGRYLF